MQAKLKFAIGNKKGMQIPAGTVLDFALENGTAAMFRGQKISVYAIPSAAFESAPVANAVNVEENFLPFDELKPGMTGSSKEGEPITILGSAVGQTGYDALVTQFGNTDELTFEQLTAGFTEDEIKELKFIAYSDKDGATKVGFYGADYATVAKVDAATEAGELIEKPFEEVQPTDVATNKAGDKLTVLGKGIGKVWFENTAVAYQLEQTFEPIEKALPEGKTGDDVECLLVKDDKGAMSIVVYCPEAGATVKVEKPVDDAEQAAAVEAINAAAKKRWENGGAELYARLQAQHQAGLESITICEEDETIRQNIEHDLSENGIDYQKTEDNKIVVEDDDDTKTEYLSSIAAIYPSVKAGLAEAGIEAYTGYTRK